MIRIVLIVCALAAAASAQADPHLDAKAHFKQAKAYQEAGAFLRAADEFKAAYALDPRAEMLFNIAQSYRLGGDKPHAVEYFTKYLAVQAEGKAADEARVLVAELQRQIDEAHAQEPPPPPPPHDTPTPPPPERPREMVLVRTSPPLRIAGLATAGAGVIGLALGVKFGLDARSASQYFDTFVGTWTPADQQRYDDGQAANRNMKIAYVVGGGLVTAGAVLYVLGSQMHAMPVATSQTVGIALGGSF